MKIQKTMNNQNNLQQQQKEQRKKNNTQNITTLHPKLYYRPIATKKKIVLVQAQPCSQQYRRESRNKPTWMQSSIL